MSGIGLLNSQGASSTALVIPTNTGQIFPVPGRNPRGSWPSHQYMSGRSPVPRLRSSRPTSFRAVDLMGTKTGHVAVDGLQNQQGSYPRLEQRHSEIQDGVCRS